MHLSTSLPFAPDPDLTHCDIVARYAENRFELTFAGTLSEYAFLHSHQSIVRAPVFQPDTGILCDTRAVESWDLSAAFIGDMGRWPELSRENRRAFLANPGFGRGVLQFLRLHAPRGQVRMFNQYPAAEQWLATPANAPTRS